jgi:hypothetical protein
VIYLIGCDHRNAQTYRNESSLTDSENCKQAELKGLIHTCVLSYRLDLIAEEANVSGVSEDQIFEIAVCAAIGQATRQYDAALAALEAATRKE